MSLTLTNGFKESLFTTQNNTPIFKVEIIDIDDGNGNSANVDISDYVNTKGSISNRVGLQLGKISPSSYSFQIKNVDNLDSFLFTLKKKYGTEFWMDKEIRISSGFKAADGTDDFIEVFRGNIDTKSEDWISQNIAVSSKDIIKLLNDFRVCTLINANDIFEYDDSTEDIRGISQIIKYGTHKLVFNSTGSNSAVTNRNRPFTATLGIPNIPATVGGKTKPKGSAQPDLEKFEWWYLPFQNEINSSLTNYSDSTLKMYYWDYIDDVWRPFTSSDMTASKIATFSQVSNDGLFVKFQDITNISLIGSTNYQQYIDGTGAKWGADADKFDPAICVESISLIVANPINVLFDILTNNNFIAIDGSVPATGYAGMVDVSDNPTTLSFSPSATDILNFTWDKTWAFFDADDARINTNYEKKTSLMTIINDIIEIVGVQMFASSVKSSSSDRRIRLIDSSPLNTDINCGGVVVSNLHYTTGKEITGFVLKTSSTLVRTQINVTNFNSSKSSQSFFDIKIAKKTLAAGETNRILQLGSGSGAMAYFYDSGNAALSIAIRYLAKFQVPIEIFQLELSKAGFILEGGDIIKISDSRQNQSFFAQIFEIRKNLNTLACSVTANRNSLQFGPDETDPLKLWAFWDCFNWSNDAVVPPNGGGPNGETYHWN